MKQWRARQVISSAVDPSRIGAAIFLRDSGPDPMNIELEKRIAGAFMDDIASGDLGALIVETEAAMTEADATAKAEHEKAVDLVASPEADKARAAMEDAALIRDRLRAALPRISARCAQVAGLRVGVRSLRMFN